MTKEELKKRTKEFSLRIIRLAESLPNTKTGNAIGKQIIRSGTSVGANYRAACRAKSDRDFINKITIVEEEADETLFWLELINESNLIKTELIINLMREADELTAIFTSIGKSMKNKQGTENPKSALRIPKSNYVLS